MNAITHKTLYIAAPRGYCAGVHRAISIVDAALEHFKPPIYVRREIVHNKTVVETYQKRGVIFVEELTEVPSKSTVIFSAHGIAPEVWDQAKRRNFQVIDATCPLVTKVHSEVGRFVKNGFSVIYIGHKNHDEAIGVLGEAPDKIQIVDSLEEAQSFNPHSEKLVVLTQTTLSIDDTQKILEALKKRFPKIVIPAKDDICYATQNRQSAVKSLLDTCAIELLYVIGSKNSSNSNRLREVALDMGVKAFLIDSSKDIKDTDWKNFSSIGLSSGASAPEFLVQGVASYFKDHGFKTQEAVFKIEDVNFALPKELTEFIDARNTKTISVPA